jgi:hypothetical protein
LCLQTSVPSTSSFRLWLHFCTIFSYCSRITHSPPLISPPIRFHCNSLWWVLISKHLLVELYPSTSTFPVWGLHIHVSLSFSNNLHFYHKCILLGYTLEYEFKLSEFRMKLWGQLLRGLEIRSENGGEVRNNPDPVTNRSIT